MSVGIRSVLAECREFSLNIGGNTDDNIRPKLLA